jgi:ABC-2 type transport system permease protein
MSRNALNIALLHIKLVVSDRRVFFFSLIVPILFTALMGKAQLAGMGGEQTTEWRIDVVNEDQGELGQRLISRLQDDAVWKVNLVDRQAALENIKRGEAAAALLVPADFSDAAVRGQTAALELHSSHPTTPRAQAAEQSIRAAMTRFAGSISAAQGAVRTADRLGLFAHDVSRASAGEPRRIYFESGFAKAEMMWQEFPLVAVQETRPARNIAPAGVNQSSPGMLVMFALLFIVGGTNILLIERQEGTLRRLLVMPMGKLNILLGKILGIYITGVIQMTLLILAGALLFKVNWGQSPAALISMVLSFALVAASLGTLLATLVRTTAQAEALASIVVMASSALGGAWWPLENVPGWMRTLGHVFPTAWAMDGFHDILVRGLAVADVLPEIGVLLGFTVLFLVIGVGRFRYE